MADDIILEEGYTPELTQDDAGLTLDDFGQGNFIKTPVVGEVIEFEVLRVMDNKNTKGKNKLTEKEFDIGLKYKDGRVRRIDIETDKGTYTLKNWELFFKLFGPKGVLSAYAVKHNKRFTGAKVSIKRLIDGGHSSTRIDDLMRIIGKSREETVKYQEEIKAAIKEQRLFEVTLLA